MPPTYLPTENDFDMMGMEIAGYRKSTSFRIQRENFVSFFGVEPYMVVIIWTMLLNHIPEIQALKNPNPKHLLWALLLLQCYETTTRNAAICRVSIKTFCKWAWVYATAIADLDRVVIRWENRFKGQKGDKCLVTVDGTTYKVHNLTKLRWKQRKEWYDFKHNHAGIKYEIAVCVITGWIVHYYGPFKGSIHDLTIFRWGLKKLLSLCEWVIGDKGYIGDDAVITPRDARDSQHRLSMKELRKRHETINGKLKTFECLRNQWRHALNKHHIAFRSCLVIVQLCIENGREVYTVDGYLDPIPINDPAHDDE